MFVFIFHTLIFLLLKSAFSNLPRTKCELLVEKLQISKTSSEKKKGNGMEREVEEM